MNHEKFVLMILIQLMCLKECCFSNSTQSISTERVEGTTVKNVTIIPSPLLNSSNSERNWRNHLELLEIFHGRSNVTGNDTTKHSTVPVVTEKFMGVDADNSTKVIHLSGGLSLNDTLHTNYTLTSEATASQTDSSFWLQSTGAVAAGVFLISAVVGYFGCVGYRRFMLKKYGNSQILVGEDVYDTRDLRYFEI